MIVLRFAHGTLTMTGLSDPAVLGDAASAELRVDPRSACLRARASAYAPIVRGLVASKLPFEDHARAYQPLQVAIQVSRTPRPYQDEAMQAWSRAKGRGVVVLPTGAGKTQVAVMAIVDKARPTLVLAPTLELVRQWHDLLAATFGVPVGIVGGGSHTVHPLTVTTYDSAYLHMDHLGNRFGLVVFDECHHLPSESYSLAAEACLAPYRLGLTATPERSDGREALLARLIGPEVYRRDIIELAGEYLATYETEQVMVALAEDEREEYERNRQVYRAFLSKNGIRMNTPQGFGDFIARSSRSAEGREAMQAYRAHKRLAFAPRAKIAYLEHLLDLHRTARTIIFTQDNRTAYEVGERFLVPVITHQTRIRERIDILRAFRAGEYSVVATSKVLNEGVDVPEASVAVVLSGSGSVREHVQRLGRVLRKQGDKEATLYELVTEQTTEQYTSERRRDHSAYQ